MVNFNQILDILGHNIKKYTRSWKKTRSSLSSSAYTPFKHHVLDFECFVDSMGCHIPYALGFTSNIPKTTSTFQKSHHLIDGGQVSEGVYYKSVIRNQEFTDDWICDVLKKCILLKKHKYKTWYAHNGGKYDFIIILRALIKMGYRDSQLDLLEINGSLVRIRVYFLKEYWIEFSDSLPLLGGGSLKKLIEAFHIDRKYGVEKQDFPHDMINKDNVKLYFGPIYKYLKNDNLALYYLLKEYKYYIGQVGGVDSTRCITLSQIALQIFQKHHFTPGSLTRITNPLLDKWIRRSYKGGRCEVFKPYGLGLIGYDINSLYPYVMKCFDMPTGKPTVYDITKGLDNFFGIAEARVTTPKFSSVTKIPFLSKHHDGKLISPKGVFEDVWTSVELQYAQKLGYKVELIGGIQFDRSRLFESFIDEYYDIKKSDTGVKGQIAKLIMNSLSGRMGLKPKFQKTRVVDKHTLLSLQQNFKVTDYQLSDGQYLASYDIRPLNPQSDLYHSYSKKYMSVVESNLASTPCAAFITGYARIELDKYLRMGRYKVWYVDTDSIYIDRPLPKHLIGGGLGQMKNILSRCDGYTVERDSDYHYKEMIFLQPKVKMGVYEVKGELKYDLTCKGINLLNTQEFNNLKQIWDVFKNAYMGINYKTTQDDVLQSFSRKRINRNFDKLTLETVLESITLTTLFNKRNRLYGDIVLRNGVTHHNVWVDTSPKNLQYCDILEPYSSYADYPFVERAIPPVKLPKPELDFWSNWDVKQVVFNKNCLSSNVNLIIENTPSEGYSMVKLGSDDFMFSVCEIKTTRNGLIKSFTEWFSQEKLRMVWDRGRRYDYEAYTSSEMVILHWDTNKLGNYGQKPLSMYIYTLKVS